jgi:hypothetical protein
MTPTVAAALNEWEPRNQVLVTLETIHLERRLVYNLFVS